MASAVYGMQRSTHRRAKRQEYDPLAERSKLLADLVWERSTKLLEQLAPEVPVDTEEIEPFDQWLLLEHVAVSLSPLAWDDPAAIQDLFNLRKQFAPQMAHDWMPKLARTRAKEKAMLPDPEITPQNPEFAKRQKRLAR